MVWVDSRGVDVSEVQRLGFCSGDAAGQLHLHTRALRTLVVGPRALDMSAVSQYAQGNLAEAVPPLQEVGQDVIPDVADERPVHGADCVEMRSVDDDLGTVGQGRLQLVHRLARRPEVR